ncbi:ParB/Srx family N-terminal domain-containing protein [Streptomyces sp. NPDC059605]|uniref:ParB/Srx family N-terminal domain-containing protein n=1 Tax=Streptomyces sp. NPDC059605 TaxID=3346882 RepID=UPI0036C80E0D
MTEQATYVRTETVTLDQLTPYPGNAKRGNVETILDSLRRNGQYRSLVVREIPDGPLIVLAGNHTMQALAAHGPGDCGKHVTTGRGIRPCGICQNEPSWEPHARCELVRCDEDTARRINIVDNRAADLGTYDNDALVELLSYLDEDYEGTGYTEADVNLLIAPPPSLEELADTYGDPESDDFWPVLKFKVPPETRDEFYGLTINSPNPNDDAERFRYLLDRARSTEEPVA